MRAIVLSAPGPVENLEIRDIPLRDPKDGQVRIRVKAFGINRSELHLRLGYAENARFPVVPGIEAVGVVDEAPGTDLVRGQQVVAMMGGMGRSFDGGYAEYTVVPRRQVIPFSSALPWATVGAVPETLQTAYGSLAVGLDLKKGQTLLIRGGTSALGYATAALARGMGATVLATTRQAERLEEIKDHALLDDGQVARQVRELYPEGVDAALELVGTPTLPDTLAATRVHGTVCFAGMLSNQWIIPDFYAIGYIPSGVRLTGYSGDATSLPPAVLQDSLDRIAAGTLDLGPATVYPFERIRDAHRDIEENNVSGKVVVVVP
ncbi:zinc-binding dehydrogenase [Actinoplanes sp. NPDC049596]|uniref:alcohol dehydrogenase catalytic domain-containing protein n=1 Tax=unclassified Actinoplanes TaxID=2626549 RepID=UPI0034140BA6